MNNTQQNQNYTYFEHYNQQQSRNYNNYAYDNGTAYNNTNQQGNFLQNQQTCNFLEQGNQQQYKNKGRPFIPPSNAPGGPDDPNRRGLREIGLKSYLRFLDEGFSPDVAIKKTYEHTNEEPEASEDTASTSLRIPENFNDHLSSPSSSANSSSVSPYTNTGQTFPNDPSRTTGLARHYCNAYDFAAKNKIHFKHMYLEKGFAVNYCIKKTMESSLKVMHKKMLSNNTYRIETLEQLNQISKQYYLTGNPKKLFFRLHREDGYTMEEAKNTVVRREEKKRADFAMQKKLKKERLAKLGKAPHEDKKEKREDKKDERVAPIAECEDRQLRVALLPKDFPLSKLDQEALHLLENAVIEEVARGWEANLQFKGIHFGAGMLLVDCENSETVEWLIFVTPQLNAWSGVDLVACLEDNLPVMYTVTMCLPKSASQSVQTSLALFNARNKGLNTEVWKLLQCRNQGKDQELTFGIDQSSLDTICANGNVIKYVDCTIPVKVNAS